MHSMNIIMHALMLYNFILTSKAIMMSFKQRKEGINLHKVAWLSNTHKVIIVKCNKEKMVAKSDSRDFNMATKKVLGTN